VGIARSKNGFPEYLKVCQYADIKLNVVICGEQTSMIGEVQFLLRSMINYKKRAHALYAIQREEEFMKGSAMTLLPQLTDQYNQLKVAARSGNVKALCSAMLYGNMRFADIKMIDNISILWPILMSGSVKAFKFIKSMMNKDEFNKKVGYRCGLAVGNNKFKVAKYMFGLEETRKYFKNEINLKKLLNKQVFKFNKYPQMTDIAIESLNLSKEKISEILLEEKGNDQFTMVEMVLNSNLEMITQLKNIVGEEVFVKLILQKNKNNSNGMEKAVIQRKTPIIKLFSSLNGIKKEYASNDILNAQCVYFQHKYYEAPNAALLLDAFNWTEGKLKELQSVSPNKVTDSVIEKIINSKSEISKTSQYITKK